MSLFLCCGIRVVCLIAIGQLLGQPTHSFRQRAFTQQSFRSQWRSCFSQCPVRRATKRNDFLPQSPHEFRQQRLGSKGPTADGWQRACLVGNSTQLNKNTEKENNKKYIKKERKEKINNQAVSVVGVGHCGWRAK